MDPIKMVPHNSPRATRSPGEKAVVAADSQAQQHARPHRARSWRRRRRQRTAEWQRRDESRVSQGYRFSSHTPSISVHCSGRGSSGFSWIPALPDDGNIPEMLARSASYWRHQEPPECWVRDYTCLAACPPSRRRLLQHHLPSEDSSLTSLEREELFSMDEVNDGSTGDTENTSSQADVESDDGHRSSAEEYSLAPLSRQKISSAENFDRLVEEYFRRL